MREQIQPLLRYTDPWISEEILREMNFLVVALSGEVLTVVTSGGSNLREETLLVQFSDEPLLIKSDTGPVNLPENCHTVGVFSQYSFTLYGLQTRYKVSAEAIKRVDAMNLAALIFHETLYRQVLKRSPQADSSAVRKIVSTALTEEGMKMSIQDWESLLVEAHLLTP